MKLFSDVTKFLFLTSLVLGTVSVQAMEDDYSEFQDPKRAAAREISDEEFARQLQQEEEDKALAMAIDIQQEEDRPKTKKETEAAYAEELKSWTQKDEIRKKKEDEKREELKKKYNVDDQYLDKYLDKFL